MAKELPRGVRINNPGNIEITKIKWQGKVTPSVDPRFEQFISPEMGIRAIARDLMTGYKRGSDTVTEIVAEWAPPTENNTKAYINSICLAMNVSPTDVIDVDNCRVMLPLIKAIIRHENGDPTKFGRTQWYSDDVILTAMRSAGVSDAPQVEPTTTVEAKGAATATIGGAGVTVIEAAYDAADKLESFKPMLETLAPSLTIAKYALLGITLIGALLVMYALVQKFRKGLA